MTVADKPEQAEKFELHLSISNNEMTAIDYLAKKTNFSRNKIKQIMQKGAVWLTQNKSTRRIRRAGNKLRAGQVLHLYYDSHILARSDFDAKLIADEKDYSVWFKPAGMLSQGSKFGDHCAIYRWAETHLQPQRNAFLVHRLDKATSGLILLAHSKKAARILSQQFSERRINKYYKAVVHGIPQIPQSIDEPLAGKPAITKIIAMQTSNTGRYSLLDIQILTGRKHQIRQHLAMIGHPIVGDRLYGDNCDDQVQQPNLCLTAYKTTFISPFDQQKKHYELGDEFYPHFPHTNHIITSEKIK